MLVVQPLQMLGYGLFTPASVYFVNESVPPADRVRGQTVMMVASNGLGGMLGGLLAASPWTWGAPTDAGRLRGLRLRGHGFCSACWHC